jgi:recombination protein RecT
MTPTETEIRLDIAKTQINNLSLPEIVNHPFIINQLKAHFANTKELDTTIAQFKANYTVLVSDENVKKSIGNADKFTVVQSLISLTKDGLSISPYDKECCIVNYGGKAVAIKTWRGKLKILKETGTIKYLDYLEIVYVGDSVKNVNGKFEHSININRTEGTQKIGVLLIARMPDGRDRGKYVSAYDILKRKKKSKMAAIWAEWEEEMWRKTAVNIFESEIGVSRHINHSDEYEDESYEQEEETPIVDANIVSEHQEQPEPEILAEQVQDSILRETLDKLVLDNPTVFSTSDLDRLKSDIDTYSDNKLQEIINYINKKINVIDSPL